MSRTAVFWLLGLSPLQAGCPAAGSAHHAPTLAGRVDPHCWGSSWYTTQQGMVRSLSSKAWSLDLGQSSRWVGQGPERTDRLVYWYRIQVFSTSVCFVWSKESCLVLCLVFVSEAKSKEQYHSTVTYPSGLCRVSSNWKLEGICLSVPWVGESYGVIKDHACYWDTLTWEPWTETKP